MLEERYILVEHENSGIFQLAVNDMLDKGYVCKGGVSIGISPSGNRAVYVVRYAQAMYGPDPTLVALLKQSTEKILSQEDRDAESNS